MPEFSVVDTPLDTDLVLPIAGKDGVVRKYSIAPPDAGQFIEISALNVAMVDALANRAMVGSNSTVANLGVKDAQAIVLGGDVLSAMIDDGISASDLRRAVRTANAWVISGCDSQVALEVWSGKAEAEKTPSAKTGAAATTTRRRTSGSGTNTRKTTR